jgi:hypothetical protein
MTYEPSEKSGTALRWAFLLIASVSVCRSNIADTFTDSLSRLTGEEQKAVKTAAFDLLPGSPQTGPLGSQSSHCPRAQAGEESDAAILGGRKQGIGFCFQSAFDFIVNLKQPWRTPAFVQKPRPINLESQVAPCC